MTDYSRNGNLVCYHCGKPATHLEILELDFPLYLCPKHHKEWVEEQPVASLSKYQENDTLDYESGLLDDAMVIARGFKDFESICLECGTSEKLKVICGGVALCPPCLQSWSKMMSCLSELSFPTGAEIT